MRKVIIFAIGVLFTLCSYSQEHIKFNGATFGLPLNEFVKGFPQKPSISTISHPPKGYNSNLCNRNAYWVMLNSNSWECQIFSSRKTNTVFRTICVLDCTNDAEQQLMLLVKTLEEKYGGGVQEKQENLGEVGYLGRYHREMLALYYYVKGRNNKRIGEIRISVAPEDKNAKSGLIELSYTDYNSQNKATREYNSLMHDAL